MERSKVKKWDREERGCPKLQVGMPLAAEVSFAFQLQAAEPEYLGSNPGSVL